MCCPHNTHEFDCKFFEALSVQQHTPCSFSMKNSCPHWMNTQVYPRLSHRIDVSTRHTRTHAQPPRCSEVFRENSCFALSTKKCYKAQSSVMHTLHVSPGVQIIRPYKKQRSLTYQWDISKFQTASY